MGVYYMRINYMIHIFYYNYFKAYYNNYHMESQEIPIIDIAQYLNKTDKAQEECAKVT